MDQVEGANAGYFLGGINLKHLMPGIKRFVVKPCLVVRHHYILSSLYSDDKFDVSESLSDFIVREK